MATDNQLFANGRISVLSTRLFGQDKFSRLAECSSTDECIRLLIESGIGGGVSESGDCDALLRAEMNSLLQLLKDLCFDNNLLAYLRCRYDYVNAKVLMKSKYMRTDGVPYCFQNVACNPDDMQQAFVNDDYSNCSMAMAHACRSVDEAFASGNRSPQVIDRLLDSAYYYDMQMCAYRSSGSLLKELYAWDVDTTNLMLIVRARNAGLTAEDYDELIIRRGSIRAVTLNALFENNNAEVLPEKYHSFYSVCVQSSDVQRAESEQKKGRYAIIENSMDMLDVHPVVDYFLKKCEEIDKIRYIFISVKNGVNKEIIKENL